MRIGFVGIGSMGGAIAAGILARQDEGKYEVLVSSKSGDSARDFAAKHGCKAVEVAQAAAAEVVILAVKPAQIGQVANLFSENQLVISVAAGVDTKTLAKYFPAKIVRAMPNIGAARGQSMTGICAGENASEADVAVAKEIFDHVGYTLRLDEAQLPAFTAIASCALAWHADFVDHLARAALAGGMKLADAQYAAAAAMGAAATLMLPCEGEALTPAQVVQKVCSPGGTTVAGLNALNRAGLAGAALEAVQAACARDAELNR